MSGTTLDGNVWICFYIFFRSIRANQHTETLQAQYHLLVQQRDEFSAKLSAAEDKESRSEAALINLQCALEQFQNSMSLMVDDGIECA